MGGTSPQQAAEPSLLRPQVYPSLLLIAVKRSPSGGLVALSLSSPQQTGEPSARRAQV